MAGAIERGLAYGGEYPRADNCGDTEGSEIAHAQRAFQRRPAVRTLLRLAQDQVNGFFAPKILEHAFLQTEHA